MDRRALRIPPIGNVWWSEVEQRWEHVGLSASLLPWRQGGEFRFDQAAHDIVQAVGQAFRAVVSASDESQPAHSAVEPIVVPPPEAAASVISEANRSSDPPTYGQAAYIDAGWSEPGPYGLRFDRHRRHVRRGSAEPVSTGKGRLQPNLLNFFIENGPEISRQDLGENWSTLGGNEGRPEDGTIAGAVCRLKEDVLQHLQLTLQTVRGFGWRVVDLAASAQPAETQSN